MRETRVIDTLSPLERILAGFATQADREQLYGNLQQRNRYRAFMESLAEDGCSCIIVPGDKPCAEAFPDETDSWCWPCRAKRVLNL